MRFRCQYDSIHFFAFEVHCVLIYPDRFVILIQKLLFFCFAHKFIVRGSLHFLSCSQNSLSLSLLFLTFAQVMKIFKRFSVYIAPLGKHYSLQIIPVSLLFSFSPLKSYAFCFLIKNSSFLVPIFQSAPAVPWKKVFTSAPFWALLFAHVCHNWTWYTVLTTLPTFMSEILRFDIKEVSSAVFNKKSSPMSGRSWSFVLGISKWIFFSSLNNPVSCFIFNNKWIILVTFVSDFKLFLLQNGFLSCLPYICDWIMIMITSQIADCLRAKGILSTGAVRKLFNSVGKKGNGLNRELEYETVFRGCRTLLVAIARFLLWASNLFDTSLMTNSNLNRSYIVIAIGIEIIAITTIDI